MGKNTSATKMIISLSSIYDKIFRVLSFEIEKLAKDDFDYKHTFFHNFGVAFLNQIALGKNKSCRNW